MTGPADTLISVYERNAARWDADRARGRPAGEKDWIARFAALATGTVLDLGCGSGEPVVPDLIAAGLKVTGVDAAPSLIGICARRFPDQEWIAADMRALDLGRQFGGLIAWHSLFHLPPDDQPAMFPLFASHLAQGAPLLFTSGTEHGETIGEWQGEPLYHGSLSTAAYETLLEENGFAVIDQVNGDETTGNANIWLAQKT